MEILLNVLALAATLLVAVLSGAVGVFRAAVALLACLVAGAVGFGLVGPLTGLFVSGGPESIWYYAADAVVLWAVFCIVFLGLRTLGDRFFRNASPLPPLATQIGGGVLGFVTGYVSVGVCLVLVQMLPLPPTIMGYSPFRYERTDNSVRRAGGLWLGWDRGVLGLYDYVLSGPLGPAETGPFDRYGDAYPPKEMIDAAEAKTDERRRSSLPGEGVVNQDDFLYFHWYRRWDYLRFAGHGAQGPVLSDEAREARRPGIGLSGRSDPVELAGVRIDVKRVRPRHRLTEFPEVRLADDEKLFAVQLSLAPAEGYDAFPLTVDSASFKLIDRDEKLYTGPMISGRAERDEDGTPQIVPGARTETPPEVTVRGEPRFHFASERRRHGDFLLEGATFTFTASDQADLRLLIFVVPQGKDQRDLRLMYEPGAPAAGD
jgi:hypothetical protein